MKQPTNKPTIMEVAQPHSVQVYTAAVTKSNRIESIDLLRGMVMVIMALDHTRDFFHVSSQTADPLDLTSTTPALFLTRWITHFCAPVFVFLAGTSGFFQSQRKSKKQLSSFLIKRGFWLIAVEVLLVNFAFSFDPAITVIGLQTIWAIGISMVFLGLAIWLPFPLLLGLGLSIVLGHNALDFYENKFPPGHQFSIPYSLLHHFGFFRNAIGDHHLLVMYPFLSWTGLMMVGYCFGKLLLLYEGRDRKRVLTWVGAGVVATFIVLRLINVYGNPEPWTIQKTSLFTFFSFLNTHKYPPSLLYMCMTIGPAILFIAWVGNTASKFARVLTVYGRVPFFYYVLHFFLIHAVATVVFFLRGHTFSEGFHNQNADFVSINFTIPGEGFSLWIVYLIWIGIVVSLYPLCKWFSEYKKNHTNWWLSYL